MDKYEITKDLLCEDVDEAELQRRAKEREKHYAAGGAAETAALGTAIYGGLGVAGLATGAIGAIAAIPLLIGAAVGIAISSGIAAGVAWLIARMTRKGYKRSQIQNAVAILKHRAAKKGLKESTIMTESVINAMIDGYLEE